MAGNVKRFAGVLLATDYDGTYVPDGGYGVQDEVRAAVRFFTDNGGRFTVCTGRTYLGFHAYDRTLMNAPVLLCNGTMAYDYEKDEPAFAMEIGEEGIEPLRGVMRDFPMLSIEMYALRQTCAIHMTERTERHFTGQGIPFTVVDDPADAIRPWNKVMLGGSSADIGRVQAYLRNNYPEIAFLPTTGSFLEVICHGTNKGVGLHRLADRLGIAYEHVYAVGDGYNDVEMLNAARLAFVPDNGSPEAKACADYIVRSNNEGCIAHVIEILSEIYPQR